MQTFKTIGETIEAINNDTIENEFQIMDKGEAREFLFETCQSINDKEYKEDRWSIAHHVILLYKRKADGKDFIFATYYSEVDTESQDDLAYKYTNAEFSLLEKTSRILECDVYIRKRDNYIYHIKPIWQPE